MQRNLWEALCQQTARSLHQTPYPAEHGRGERTMASTGGEAQNQHLLMD